MKAAVAIFLATALAIEAAPLHGVPQSFLHAGGGPKIPKGEKSKKSEKFWPFESKVHHPSDRLTCGVTETVGANTDKYEDCPAACPYFAQNRKDDEHCTFLCVPGPECGRWNALKPIPDSIKNTKTCRGPKVSFCRTPNLDGTDTCNKCMSGYRKHDEDQQCYFDHWTAIIVVGLIFVVVFTVVIVWVVDLCCREATNDEAFEKTLKWRSRAKVLNREHGEIRRVHPLSTNLCKTNVAGPGMLLHFNFQAFFIVWPLCVATVWTVLALFHNELFILGTRKFGTPRHNCILVAWGYETQQRLMWTKVLFLAIVYVFSFITFLLFSVRQNRIYQEMDAHEKTMKDFAVEIKGLPEISGKEASVEKDVQKAVEAATGMTIVGVSIAWKYQDKQEVIEQSCSKDLHERDVAMDIQKATGKKATPKQVQDKIAEEDKAIADFNPTKDYGAIRKFMYEKERDLMGPDEEDDEDMTLLLQNLVTSNSAFVVFNTEEDKEAALNKEDNTIKFDYKGFDTCMLTMEPVANEPANLNWHNFGDENPNAYLMNFLKGIFKVYVPALLIWFFGFYCPYAWSLYNFNYDNGAELPGYFSLIFTIVVCGGNATMYVVCDICCDIIGFRYKDTKQVAYMLMYLVACMINVFLDMFVTYLTAYKVMVGLDFRTYHGDRLADIKPFTEQFETYAMQRSLGGNVYAYAWPSTFFLCFVLEPFVTIMIPYQIGKMVIRKHKEIRGTTAEAYLMAFEFDLGRYADILLNVFLGILIFWFPGGYIWTLFYAMAFSHCFIYCFDHWRVISVIPSIKIVSTQVDWWAQACMVGLCAMIMGCLVFKANCETYAGYCLYDVALITNCTIAGSIHFIVHMLLLVYLVPKLTAEYEDDARGMTYEAAATIESRTWFSVNPVHCLRSKYIHKHMPHCRLASYGKEHLMEPNAKIGCYFEDVEAETEDYGVRSSISGIRASFSSKSSTKSETQ